MFHRRPKLTISFVLALSTALGAPGSANAEPVIIEGGPVAPLPAGGGTGLCGAQRSSSEPDVDFWVSTSDGAGFIEKMNTFFDAGQEELVSSVVRTPLDLSNKYGAGGEVSFGDFLDAASDCPAGGCDFVANEPDVAFGMRLRGYLAVPPEYVEQPVHFGIYADDAVALVIYDSAQAAYPVLVQPPALGAPSWRMTNTVTFAEEGLYPVEILYAAIVEHSELEVSLLVGEFADFQLRAGEAASTNLAESGFTLLEPAAFHRSVAGDASASDEDACAQCGREFIGQSGNNGCEAGSYCNDAALCAPCAVDAFCGPSCDPCSAAAPRCALVEGTPACVACVSDADCDDGEVCDSVAHACVAPPPEPGPDAGSGGAGGAGAGGGGEGGGGASEPVSVSGDGGCGCRVGGEGRQGGGLAFALAGLGLGLAGARRRTRAASRWSAATERGSR
ncbi:outer membrane exchange protein TraA family protein [Sorangium atrum]|uniref:Outer membrane exchange protein TraA family protein n=1 Tax=Sorangium atrum TaxID=2995308 RepID=A0ABT5C6Q2_9BACT|nr:outer membrane exchange protein TraA family protein [Sorangium aterium]MDC0682108.1 outer membrane exchange protein TraA family protein [Sorangium aterium]